MKGFNVSWRTIAIALLMLCGFVIANIVPDNSLAAPKGRQTGRVKASLVLEPSQIGHIGHLDYLNGFRGRKFGSDISEFTDLKLLRDNGAEKAYFSATDDLEMDQAKLQSINYTFYNGKFMGVLMTSKGLESCEYIYRVFVTAFGSGIRPPAVNGREDYFWTGKVANAHITLRGADNLELWIGNNRIQEDRDKELRDRLVQTAIKSF
jgi:hypothetical protein